MSVFPKWLLVLLLAGLALFISWYFSNLIICILLAGVLSILSKPVFDFYRKIKIGKYNLPASVAAAITIASFMVLTLLIFAITVPLVIQQIKILSDIDLNKFLNDLREPIDNIEWLLHRYNVIESENQSLTNFLQVKLSQIISLIDIPSLLQSVFETAGNFFFIFFTTLFILFFFLKEENLFLRLLSVFIPENQNNKLSDVFLKVRKMLFRYFVAVLTQFLLVAVFVTATLHFLNVKNALLIGLLAGIFNIVPYIGAIIGFTLAVIIGTLAHLQTGIYHEIYFLTIKIAGVFITMQLLDNNILQPYLFSKSTDAHPLEIFIVIIAVGTVSGIGGMIIAVPAYTIIRIMVFEFFSESKFIKRISSRI